VVHEAVADDAGPDDDGAGPRRSLSHKSSRESWLVDSGALQGRRTPLLGRLELVEGEQVQPGDARAGRGDGRGRAVEEAVRAVPAGHPEPQDPAGVPGDEAG